jgi:Cysteine-rich CPCC
MKRGRSHRRYPCPCCGYQTLEEPPGCYDICPICFWEDDPIQRRDPWYAGGANDPSLVEAQQNYQRYGAKMEGYDDVVRGVQSDDVRDPDWEPYDPAD